MAGKYLLGATGGLVSYIAGNYLIGKRYFYFLFQLKIKVLLMYLSNFYVKIAGILRNKTIDGKLMYIPNATMTYNITPSIDLNFWFCTSCLEPTNHNLLKLPKVVMRKYYKTLGTRIRTLGTMIICQLHNLDMVAIAKAENTKSPV